MIALKIPSALAAVDVARMLRAEKPDADVRTGVNETNMRDATFLLIDNPTEIAMIPGARALELIPDGMGGFTPSPAELVALIGKPGDDVETVPSLPPLDPVVKNDFIGAAEGTPGFEPREDSYTRERRFFSKSHSTKETGPGTTTEDADD